MARRNDSSILDLLMLFPWWVSVATSASVYAILSLVVPNLAIDNPYSNAMLQGLSTLAPHVALFLLIPAPFSYLKQRQRRQRLDAQQGIKTIRALPWREFEELIGEAYRRKGYKVIENGSVGADGGIDIRLHKNGGIHLVQCKQWRSQKVGVAVVREMFGVLTAEQAVSMTIITSGMFTQEAKNFAEGKAMDLVDGVQLQSLISQVQSTSVPTSGSDRLREQPPSIISARLSPCPKCGSELAVKTAKKGPRSGSQFYGCTAFPRCRYTAPVTTN